MKSITLRDGQALAYEEQGEGPPLLLIMGTGADRSGDCLRALFCWLDVVLAGVGSLLKARQASTPCAGCSARGQDYTGGVVVSIAGSIETIPPVGRDRRRVAPTSCALAGGGERL